MCRDTCAMGLMWRSEGSFVEPVLFFGLYIGPADLSNSGLQLYVASDLLAETFVNPEFKRKTI